ncbi:MAG: arylsulfatase [Blastocatellia bacterium]
MRKTILFFLLSYLALVVQAQAQTRPNILLIMTDDQGYGDFSLHGNQYVKTPVLDRFAREGTQFERFYVNPLCAPTRASLLTGRYWLRGGVWGVTNSRETMRADETTIAEILQKAGWRTGLFGKWHNGEQYPYTPEGQGFDEFLGFHNGHWNRYFDSPLLRGSRFIQTRGYISDALTDAAMRFIEGAGRRPFFAYAAYNAPHAPFQVPDKYFDKYRAMGLDATLAGIYGMCENIDDNVGRLLAKLEALRLRENTIVLFLTDNGPNGDRFNGGMRGRKGNVHEGGHRVPLFVQYPARFKMPRVIPRIAAHIDILPTLLELCGVPQPREKPLDGRSLVPLLEGQTAWPARTLFTLNNGGNEVRMFPGAARTQQYRAVNDGRGWQLYDMLADPAEKQDLAKQKPDVLAGLVREYETWYRDVTRAGFRRFPIPVGYKQENPVLMYPPQADFTGSLRFYGKNGYANDWLAGWTDAASTVTWKLDVVTPGIYEVALQYACAPENAGSRIRLTAGAAQLEMNVRAARAEPLLIPDRVERTEAPERNWPRLVVGKIRLEKGLVDFVISVADKKGSEVMELKSLSLRRVSAAPR